MTEKNKFKQTRQANKFYQRALDKKEADRLADPEFIRNQEKKKKIAVFESTLTKLHDRSITEDVQKDLIITGLQYIACQLDTDFLSSREYDAYRRDNGLIGKTYSSTSVRSVLGSWPSALHAAGLEVPTRKTS